MRNRKKCGYAECAYARISYTASVKKAYEVKQSQPWQKSKIYLAFQSAGVDGRSIDFLTIGTGYEWWHVQVLGLHCDDLLDLAATGRFTILVGYVGGHRGSREYLSNAFPLTTLYTESENWKQQVKAITDLDPRYT